MAFKSQMTISTTGRKKNDKSLFTMQQADEKPSERFLAEVASALRAHELVRDGEHHKNCMSLYLWKLCFMLVVVEATAPHGHPWRMRGTGDSLTTLDRTTNRSRSDLV